MKKDRGYIVTDPASGKSRRVRWNSRVRRSMKAKGWKVVPVRGEGYAPMTDAEIERAAQPQGGR